MKSPRVVKGSKKKFADRRGLERGEGSGIAIPAHAMN